MAQASHARAQGECGPFSAAFDGSVNMKLLCSILTGAALVIALPIWIISAASAADYVLDPTHTSISFRVGHFHLSSVQGRFNKISGTFSFNPAKPEASKVDVVVDVASIDTNEKARDNHLCSPEYFDVVRFHKAVFRSTRIVVTGARTGLMAGELAILGVTIPVTLEVTFNGISEHPLGKEYDKFRGITVAGFSARTTISRNSFGMTNGRGIKGDKAELLIEVEGWQKP
jgi:polyisoprenoid-binding protein YceI